MNDAGQRARDRTLAFDIGGTKLACGLVGADGGVAAFDVVPTHTERGPEAIIGELFALGERAIAAAAPDDRVVAVGISCGGPLDAAAGRLVRPMHLPGWVDIPITARATESFGLPAYLENDATASALGEFLHGAGRHATTMLYLTLSTGVGGGAVIDGRLHRGVAGNGGEFGHTLVQPGGRMCSCGRRGCLEAYASGTSIAARAREAMAQGAPSTLQELEAVTSADVVAAAESGDALAAAIWDETTSLLGSALTDLANVFEPELIVLGGGVARAGRALIDPVRRRVRAEAMEPVRRAVDIVVSELGDAVGVVGAGAIAFDRLDAGEQMERVT